MDLLDALGAYEYNWSFGESQVFNSEQWLSSEDMRAIFKGYTFAGCGLRAKRLHAARNPQLATRNPQLNI